MICNCRHRHDFPHELPMAFSDIWPSIQLMAADIKFSTTEFIQLAVNEAVIERRRMLQSETESLLARIGRAIGLLRLGRSVEARYDHTALADDEPSRSVVVHIADEFRRTFNELVEASHMSAVEYIRAAVVGYMFRSLVLS